MIEKNLKNLLYVPTTPMRRAVADLYRKEATMCLVCQPGGRLVGIVTRADIKQALLQGLDPHTSLQEIMNVGFTSAPVGTSEAALRRLAKKPTFYGTSTLGKIPLLDKRGRVKGLYILPEVVKAEKQKTVLVTGGAGYIGSFVCRRLLKKGYKVVVIDTLLYGDDGIEELYKHKNFSLVQGDIADLSTLIKIVPTVDSVIHLAGIVGDPASSLDPLHTMEKNHFATKALIDVCLHYHVARFVFASSCSVYGAAQSLLTERSSPNPVSLYAKSKLYSERELLQAAGADFRPILLRFGTLYGLSPRMRFDLVVNTMTANAYFKSEITIDGGEQWRPLLHVDDAARACIAALEAPHSISGRIYNVGNSKNNYQIADIARSVAAKLPGTRIKNLDTVKDRRDYRVSFEKIRKELDFKTMYTLPKGITEMLRVMQNGSFKNWSDKKYSDYLTAKEVRESI